MKTLDIDECAEFLKVKSTVVSDMVGTGELPGARIGRAWVFLEDDLIDYVRTQIRNQRRERQSAQFEKRQDEEGRNLDQDNLTMLSTVLRNRRSPITPSPSHTVNQVA
jgi:excisionase family DNA binding protein